MILFESIRYKRYTDFPGDRATAVMEAEADQNQDLAAMAGNSFHSRRARARAAAGPHCLHGSARR